GREGRPSQSPFRKARRQTLYSCLVQPALEVDARFLNESLAPVSRASSAMSFTKNWNYSVPSAVRPLDFRDHIAVQPLTGIGNTQPLRRRVSFRRRSLRTIAAARRGCVVCAAPIKWAKNLATIPARIGPFWLAGKSQATSAPL